MAATDSGAGPRILGLTGPIGCGKTTVGDMLLELGALERIDADRVVHALMAPGTDTTREIRETFGDEALLPDGSVNRAVLGRMVFADPEALRRLEAITHPAVRRAIRQHLSTLGGSNGVVVIDAVKLLQSELLALADVVWVVRCRPEEQMQRLTEFRQMERQQAESRVRAQPSFEHERVTTVIENSGSLEELRELVTKEWEEMLGGWGIPSPPHPLSQHGRGEEE